MRKALSMVPWYGRYRARSQPAEYLEEVIEFLAGLEIEAFKVAKDRRTRVWILNLP